MSAALKASPTPASIGEQRTKGGVALALIAPWALYVAHVVINLEQPIEMQQDGLLSYGIWRVAAGEAPHVDFRAYDPARYYWGALFTSLFGDALWVHRLSAAAFGAVGLALGLALIARATASPLVRCVVGMMLVLWSVVLVKMFDTTSVMLGLAAAFLLVRNPTLGSHAVAGAALGLVFFIARNHAFYLSLAFVVLGSALALGAERPWRELPERAAAGLLGMAAGALPLWSMLAFERGAGAAYRELFSYQQTAPTALPLSFPTPVCALDGSLPALAGCVSSWGLALTFAGILVLVLAGWAALPAPTPKGEARPLLIAALAITAATVPYMIDRSGLAYVALVSFPATIAVGALAAAAITRQRHGLAIGLIAAAAAVTVAASVPRNVGLAVLFKPELFTVRETPVGPVALARYEGQKDYDRLRRFEAVAELFAGGACRDGIFLAGDLPLLYYLFQCRSPVWDIRPLRPASVARDQRLVAELAATRPRWVVMTLRDEARADERLFEASYPRAAEYVHKAYERVASNELAGIEVWERARGAETSSSSAPMPTASTAPAPSNEPARLTRP